MFKISSQHILIVFALLLCGILLIRLDINIALLNDNALRPTSVKGAHFPKMLVDPIGEEYPLLRPPQRIVSVTLGTDEILSALVDSDRVSGVTHLADDPIMSNIPNHYPAHVKRITGEVEEILSLEPDLVFVAAYTRAETVRLLLGSKVPVVRLSHYRSFSDIEANIRLVASVVGNEPQAEAMFNALQQNIQSIKQRVSGKSRPRVLYYSMNGYTAGAGTTIDEIIEIAGGYNVINETHIKGTQKISEEMAIGLEPDVILMNGWAPDSTPTPSEFLAMQPAWQNTPAILNNRVYDLKGAWVLSVSQYSWHGIAPVARLLHPEVFE
ncbi:ABC transporter substrate-binding protein [Alkalimarinus coralli]|uniref:ABC transporter substrate-binding protein n=1 Tax=Alkalimarinus coralli TaxID=2935863 RepID=UPI00202B38B8|nr:ABC transporter substrate-binding protein [Alkalimarinus coralli]